MKGAFFSTGLQIGIGTPIGKITAGFYFYPKINIGWRHSFNREWKVNDALSVTGFPESNNSDDFYGVINLCFGIFSKNNIFKINRNLLSVGNFSALRFILKFFT